MQKRMVSCKSCSAAFCIDENDCAFYVSMNVPEPTFCPRCRLRRRLAWINFRSLYARALPHSNNKQVISMYSADKPHIVIDDREWWGDSFDARTYGRDYDFSRPFFKQFQELLLAVPLPHLHRDFSRMQNSNYCNAATGLKNCYLCMAADEAEDTYYSFKITKLKNCVDVSFAKDSELCGNSTSISHCYNVHFSKNCESSNDLYFCSDLIGCASCIGCVNLRNQSYCIFNKQFSKEEYEHKLKSMRLDTASGVESARKDSEMFISTQPHRFMHGRNNVDVSGDSIYNSKNVHDSYGIEFSESCRYVSGLDAIGVRNADSYDWSQFGIGSEKIYESSWVGLQCNTILFSYWNYYAHNLTYCFGCHSSDNLFGCIGLRKQRYCILNKQYTKEEYEELVPKIRAQMMSLPYQSSDGTRYCYGEFFPPELSPFGYNETEAQDHLSLEKNRAVEQGFNWFDSPQRDFIADAIPSGNIPDSAYDFSKDDLAKTYTCTTFSNEGEDALNWRCTGYYKFLPQEIAWYKERGIALPRLCSRCRNRTRVQDQLLFHSYQRSCMCINQSEHEWHTTAVCGVPFTTSYAPDRPEPIYCEKCYQQTVV